MVKCHLCKKKGCFIECKYCNYVYCTRCLQPEMHECKQLMSCIENKKKMFEKSLQQNNTCNKNVINNYVEDGNAY